MFTRRWQLASWIGVCLLVPGWLAPRLLLAQGPTGNQAGGAQVAQPAGPAAQRPVGPANAVAAVGFVPSQPEWFPLAPEHQKYLDDILKYWEYQSSQTQRLRSKFLRWEYDAVVHREFAATISEGSIQYAAPDKGLFHVEKLWDLTLQTQNGVTAPVVKDGKPNYTPRQELVDDHWVCDGKSIFQFDVRNKQIIERKLPPEMQGKQIAEGPLPFLFSARAETIKDRYWIRVIVPPPEKGAFHLEAIPRQRAEAADFKAIRIVIDEEEFLPKALMLFDRVGGRTTYEFKDRERNWNLLPEKLNPFHQQFYKPTPPAGWKLVEEPMSAAPPTGLSTGVPPNQVAPPRQATRPGTMK